MTQKSLPRRALKYAVVSSSIIMLLVLYAMLARDITGSSLEVAFRLVVTTFGVFGAMWLVFIFYLFTNPDADKPREKEF
ncbi:hypothetical protein J3L16_15325 [Alteromonas sp. 5E99-2]|uniref:hypothetical protein n=1 Tax=Alteromonas sp. 5E99-2 TaxID=2817683 RepID=UPI001A97D8BC|nr:hypothetical protein [Alteromonas sp. 5E99-2]MBO1257064.1 hypothetical protein [Alteromonas sp. 5E99-2]